MINEKLLLVLAAKLLLQVFTNKCFKESFVWTVITKKSIFIRYYHKRGGVVIRG